MTYWLEVSLRHTLARDDAALVHHYEARIETSEDPEIDRVAVGGEGQAERDLVLGHELLPLGTPPEDRSTRVLWTLPAIYVIGELGARCMFRGLPRSEQAEYERLTKP